MVCCAHTLLLLLLLQVQHLEQLEELLLRNEPSLLDTMLVEVVPLQVRCGFRRCVCWWLAASKTQQRQRLSRTHARSTTLPRLPIHYSTHPLTP